MSLTPFADAYRSRAREFCFTTTEAALKECTYLFPDEQLKKLGLTLPSKRVESRIAKALNFLADNPSKYQKPSVGLHMLSALFPWMCRMNCIEYTVDNYRAEVKKDKAIVRHWLASGGEIEEGKNPHDALYNVIGASLTLQFFKWEGVPDRALTELLEVKLAETQCPLRRVDDVWMACDDVVNHNKAQPNDGSLLDYIVDEICDRDDYEFP